jgi:hypothetical protein
MAPLVLNVGGRWRLVVIFMLQPLYIRETTPVPVAKEGGWATRVGLYFWGIEKYLVPVGIRTSDHAARSLVAMLTTLCRMLYRYRV